MTVPAHVAIIFFASGEAQTPSAGMGSLRGKVR
jgi:hypothetical protein